MNNTHTQTLVLVQLLFFRRLQFSAILLLMATKQKMSIFVVFFIAFMFGFSVFLVAHKDYFIERDPAAIPGKLMQFNHLNSEQLRDELVGKIKIKPVFTAENLTSKSIVFTGLSSQICKSYAEIHVEFHGEGMSTNGEPTKMHVTVPCQAGQDPSEIASIILPIQEILRQKPKDAEFTFTGFPGSYKFTSVADSWPQLWVLHSVQFANQSLGSVNEPGLSAASPREAFFSKTASANSQPIVLEF